MVTTAAPILRGLRFLLPLVAVQACFDVQSVDPGSGNFLIDDFEDGDTLPSTSLFHRWRCYNFNPDTGQDPEQTVICDLEQQPGDQSAYGLRAGFMLHDGKPEGVQYAGAGLGTFVDSSPAVDFSDYRALAFNLRVELGDPPPPAAMLQVQLGCNSVRAIIVDDKQLYLDVSQLIAATNTWARFLLPLVNFTQRSDEVNRFAAGPGACLALVDSIRFEIVSSLTYGQSGSGVIHIDDVHLE